MQVGINFGAHLRKRAELGGSLEGLVDVIEGRRFTYAELNDRADRLARALSHLGVNKGDRVAALLPNNYRYADIYYGPTRSGIIIVPLNTRLAIEEVAYILRDSGSVALIYSDDHADLVAALHVRTGANALPVKHWINVGNKGVPGALRYDDLIDKTAAGQVAIEACDDDPLFIMYTSGTTGYPKGTVQTHRSYEWAMLTVIMATDMRYRDRYLVSMPLFHVAAFGNMATTFYRGGTVVLMQKFDAAETWRLLRDERINITLAVPTMLQQLLATYDPERHKPLALRWFLTGAQPVPVSMIKAIEGLGFQIVQAYGLTEAGGVASVLSPEDAMIKVGSIGKSFYHTELRVVDVEGRDCAPDEPGELVVISNHCMRDYWNQPEATREAFRGGVLHTSDVGVRDIDGFFYIRDRLKDMIISGGENIFLPRSRRCSIRIRVSPTWQWSGFLRQDGARHRSPSSSRKMPR